MVPTQPVTECSSSAVSWKSKSCFFRFHCYFFSAGNYEDDDDEEEHDDDDDGENDDDKG